MRIGILPQPLYINYGGILQCYALQKKLQQLGHETVILQREFKRNYTIVGGFKHYIRQFAKLLLGKQPMWRYYVSQEKRDYIAKYTTPFINQHIKELSKKCYSTEELIAEFNSHNFDAVIVAAHKHFTESETKAIDDFCASNNAIVFCDQTSNFYENMQCICLLYFLRKVGCRSLGM